MPPPNVIARLREATRPIHAQLEKLSYFQALFRGELAVESYVGHLRALAVLHGTLEQSLSNPREGRVKAVWSENLRRLPKLQADLEFFAPRDVLDIGPAHVAARGLANHVLRRAAEQPLSVLGYLYVLEGSIGGAQVLAPRFRAALGLAGLQGMAYFSWDPPVAAARWQAFGERMNALPFDEAEAQALVEAALEAFAGLQQLFAALHPVNVAQLTREVASLNPEAGDHPIPTDPGELDAALRAGQRCWQEFPYFAWRYGERGWRYTRSDGAWLVTLAAEDQGVVDAQTIWLAGILASRGMPSVLLQRHLELLFEELRGRLPERPGVCYRTLLNAADRLAERRRAAIADADLEAVANRFEHVAGPDWRARLPRTGLLLGCAVADRAQGVAQAVTSLEGWMTDPQRFPPPWIAAVHEALWEAEARVRIRPSPSAAGER